MVKNKTQLISLLAVLSFSLVLANVTKATQNQIETNAQTLPTNVNITDRTGSELATYYSGINGKSGDQLLAALNQIIDDHREYDYDSDTDRYAYKIMDRNWTLSPLSAAQLANFNYATDNPYIRKFYADYNDSAATADLFKNPADSRVSFDKEHLWAQSLGDFGRTGGAGSDFHMLVPSDVKGNQQLHSNYNFAIPTSGINTYTNDKGTYVGINGYMPGYPSQKVMEPLDQYKGDIARAMFYMPARYYVYQDTLHPKLTLVNGSPEALTASPSQPGLAGDLATLLQWHLEDPVDEYEIHRNNLIYNNFQLNRNPFIDFPQLAEIAYDSSYTGSGASISSSNACVIGSCPFYQASEADLNDLVITNNASTIDYVIGDTLDLTGLEVTAHYSNFTSSVVTSYTTSISGETGSTLTSGGTKTVTITYQEGGLTEVTSYDIYVASTANLTVTPSKTTIKLGETYSDTSLTGQLSFTTVNGTFNRPLTNNQLTIGTPNNMQLGIQTIQVSYRIYQTSFNVTVTNQGVNVGQTAPDLFFSEYIEGSSNNKALEIYNGTGNAVNLTGYTVKFYANSNNAPNTTLSLSGTLASGDVYVIYNSSANTTIKNVGDIASGVAGFNGDDAVTLENDGQLIDIIGVIARFQVFAADVTLVRKSSIFSGNIIYSANEWDTYSIDTFSYLGSHSINWTTGSVTEETQALSYAQYFLATTYEYCDNGTKDVLTIPWSTLKAEYGYMASSTKDEFFTSTNITIIDARARYILLVDRYSLYASDNFMVDGSGDLLVTNPKNPTTINLNHGGNLMLLILVTTGIVGIVSIYISRRKKVL
jgi:endonuclease I